MKRIICIFVMLFLLSGCSVESGNMDRAMTLRGKLQQKEVSFETTITADYGDKIHTFSMECRSDVQGNLRFTVTEPETIAGISGTVAKGSGKLSFDDQVLAFDILADGLISPVSGPWVMVETLRGGYLTSCCREGEYLRLAIDDSYAEDALHLDIWLGESDLPVQADILWQGRRLLSICVKTFTFL